MIDCFMKHTIRFFWLTGLVIIFAGCAGQGVKTETANTDKTQGSVKDEAAGVKATLLIFTERDVGGNTEPFTTRILVSKKYLHMSDSYSPADYVLFDRAARTIFNVTREDKTIFVIKDKPNDLEPPIPIKYVSESQPSNAMPKIDGRQATHYRFFANEKHCYDSVVLGEDFLPDVLGAMREFREVLANEHAASLHRIPKEMLDACDLAVNIFYPTKHMEHGFPIREWDRRGFQRFLKDYRVEVSVPEETFTLPRDFARYSLEDLESAAGVR